MSRTHARITVYIILLSFWGMPVYAGSGEKSKSKSVLKSAAYFRTDIGYRFAYAGLSVFDHQYISGGGHYGNSYDASFKNYSFGKGAVLNIAFGKNITP